MSTQVFWLLLVVVCAGAYLLAKVLPPPTGVAQLGGAKIGAQQDPSASADQDPDNDDYGWRRGYALFAEDNDDNPFDAGVNIDGTPMMDDSVDIHGNVFGSTDDWLSNSFG